MLLEIGIALAVVAVLSAVWWLDGAVPGWIADRFSSPGKSDAMIDLVLDALMTIDPCGLGVVDSEERYRLAAAQIAASLEGPDPTTTVSVEQHVVSALTTAGCGEPVSARRLRRLMSSIRGLRRT